MLKSCVFFATLLASSSTFASSFRSHSSENEWNSPAISGLGGVGSLSENTVDKFFSDPSSLADYKPPFVLQWLGLHTNYSQDLLDTVNDFQKVMDESNASSDNNDNSNMKSTIKALDALEKAFGRKLIGNMNFNFVSFKVGGFSLIPYASSLLKAEARVPSLPRAGITADIYAGLGIGYAREINKKFDAAVSIRPGARIYADYKIDISTIGDMATSSTTTTTSSSSTDSKYGTLGTGMYFPVDIGLGFKPWPIARFAMVIRDFAGASAFNSIGTDTTAPTYPMRVNLIANVQALQKGMHTIMLGSELQDVLAIGGPSGIWYRWQWAAQYKFKLPFRAVTTFGVNTGLQSGYPAYGVFLDMFLVKFEYARYTQEEGYYIGQRPVARQAFKLWSQLTF